MTPPEASEKSRSVALALALVLGPFGGHRFYAGKNQSGALMACTLGGLGIWYLYDVIIVGSGSFRDAQGKLISRWELEEAAPRAELPQDVLEELYQLRTEMAELHERVDFAERLLANPRGGEQRSGQDS